MTASSSGPVTELGNLNDHHQWPLICYNCDSVDSITRSAILVLLQTKKIAGRNISGFEKKSLTWQNSLDSKAFGFKVPTWNSRFKISGDMTRPGSFYFGFVRLCVDSKTNPILKRFGFVMNPPKNLSSLNLVSAKGLVLPGKLIYLLKTHVKCLEVPPGTLMPRP